MTHAGVRRGHVAVLTSWMRDERHNIALGSLLTVCVRDEAGGEVCDMVFRVIFSRFMGVI